MTKPTGGVWDEMRTLSAALLDAATQLRDITAELATATAELDKLADETAVLRATLETKGRGEA